MSREPLLARTAYAAWYPIQTRWEDNDIYGHVNNVVHYKWFDTAVNGWMIDAGLLDPEHGTSICLVVETGCRYARSVAFPQALEAGLRVDNLGGSSVRWRIGLFLQGEDDPVAEGQFVHVHVDRTTRKPQPFNDKWRAGLAGLILRRGTV